MLKHLILALSFLMLSAVALPALGEEVNRRVWDEEYTGYGDPVDQRWTRHGSNYHTINGKFTPTHTVAGWVTGSGNAGSYWSKAMPSILVILLPR